MAKCLHKFVATRYQSDPLPCIADLLQVVVLSVSNGLLPVAECRLLRKRSDVLVSCSTPADQSLRLARSNFSEYVP